MSSPGACSDKSMTVLRELLAAREDGSAFWLYTRVLVAFRESGDSDEQAGALVKDAWSANEHVPAILAGTKPPVISDDGYVTMGCQDEATYQRHGIRPDVAPYARGGCVADKACRHFGIETSDLCDYALIRPALFSSRNQPTHLCPDEVIITRAK